MGLIMTKKWYKVLILCLLLTAVTKTSCLYANDKQLAKQLSAKRLHLGWGQNLS